MKVDFPSSFFVANRQRLRNLVGDKPIIISANGLLQKGADSTYPFHQDANFWYLTGINDPGIVLVITGIWDFIILPKRSAYQDTFEGTINNRNLMKISGVTGVLSFEEGWKELDRLLGTTKKVATITPPDSYLEFHGMYTNPGSRQLIKRIKDIDKEIPIENIAPYMIELRVIKQPIEVKAINSAIDITSQAIKAVRSNLGELSHEYSVESVITAHFINNNVSNAWKPIIASGNNACILHYDDNTSVLAKNDLVVIDIGAEVSHYAADITRTLIIGTKPSARQQAVHQAVLDIQNYAIGLQKPGSTVVDNEKKIRQYMATKLIELRLIKRATTAEINKFYPHSTSHFLGLEPHDVGDYKLPLKPGAVLTVEPGIYIPQENIGVRIEDDVLITATGNKVLSAGLSRDLL